MTGCDAAGSLLTRDAVRRRLTASYGAAFALVLLAVLIAPRAYGADHHHEVFAPDFVRQLAEERLDPASPRHQAEYRLYTEAFLRGYLSPRAEAFRSDPAFQAGQAEGAAYRIKQPHSLVKVLALYGYKPVSSTGRFSFDMEEMSFVPARVPSEKWWLYSGWLDETSLTSFSWCRRGTVTGYLSESGRYGHRGAYANQLIVQEFHCDE